MKRTMKPFGDRCSSAGTVDRSERGEPFTERAIAESLSRRIGERQSDIEKRGRWTCPQLPPAGHLAMTHSFFSLLC
jgi:hypothetical protein